MRDAMRVLATIGLGLIVSAGCSGNGTSPTAAASQAAPGGSAAGGAGSGQASKAPAVSSPAGAPSAAPAAAGGRTSAGVCSLITTDELAGIFGLPVTTTVLTGPPDTCDVQANGAPLAAFVLTSNPPSYVYDAYANDTGATSVSGMGDKAAYDPGQGLLVIMKGGTMLSVSAYGEDKTPEQRLELMKKIGAIASGRM